MPLSIKILLGAVAVFIAGCTPASAAARGNNAAAGLSRENRSPTGRDGWRQPLKATAQESASRQPWSARQHVSGDWNGLRRHLDSRGFVVRLGYSAEIFAKLAGGIDRSGAAAYRGNVDFTLTLDTSAAGLWRGGSGFIHLQNGHGSGISDRYVGDLQTLSNIDAADFTQLSEYWVEQSILGSRFRVKLGKQDANCDFGTARYAADFINSSFGVIPTVPMPTFPDPALGAAVFVGMSDHVGVGAGFYDGAPKGGTSGFRTALDGEGGFFSILETVLSSGGRQTQAPRGAYRFGIWHHSEQVDEITSDPAPRTFANDHGFYFAFDQPLTGAPASGGQGPRVAAFGQFGWAPADRNELGNYVGAGLVLISPLRGRDDDVLGVAVARAGFGARARRLHGLADETAFELFYLASVTPWFSVQPDIQLIVNPGGAGADAVVSGLRFRLDL